MIRQSNDREIRTSLVELNLSDDLIVEGKAVVFGETVPLFKIGDDQYFERIEKTAFLTTIMDVVYFYYNHNDFCYASTKNKTLELYIRDDGLYFKAHLPDTNAGRDLYYLIKRGDITQMSFGFTIAKDGEKFDEKTNTFTVKSINRLFEISVVDFPAYENTNISISARSEIETIEASRQAVLKQQKQKIILKTLY